MFYCGLMKVEKLKKCNASNAGIAHILVICIIAVFLPVVTSFLVLVLGSTDRWLPFQSEMITQVTINLLRSRVNNDIG